MVLMAVMLLLDYKSVCKRVGGGPPCGQYSGTHRSVRLQLFPFSQSEKGEKDDHGGSQPSNAVDLLFRDILHATFTFGNAANTACHHIGTIAAEAVFCSWLCRRQDVMLLILQGASSIGRDLWTDLSLPHGWLCVSVL